MRGCGYCRVDESGGPPNLLPASGVSPTTGEVCHGIAELETTPGGGRGGQIGWPSRGHGVESLILHMPTEKTRGRLRALSDWLRGSTPSPPPAPNAAATAVREGLPSRIGHYAITGKLGQGGMGVVYAARDERLERTVAVKTMSSLAGDETARKRFWREARAAASVNHPNVCQIYEIGEDGGELFIAMELLEGEALAERLRRGPLSVSETMPIGLGDPGRAVGAARARHRPPRPQAVERVPDATRREAARLRPRAAERPGDLAIARRSATELTRTGMVLGTPRYMAPEQVTGEGLDARSDLFAVGAILFEMLAGRPAFGGRNAVEILHATLYEQPPALTGSPAVAAVDRVIRRALAKRPADRPASADAMAEELRAVRGMDGDDTSGPGPHAHAPRGAAVPRPARRSRDGLPGLQPAGRHRDVAVGHRLAGRALERHRRALRRRGAGPQGARRRGRRRPRRDGHAAALRRPAAGRGAARRGAGRARCSRRTPSSRRWATCSACRTTSPGAWSRRSRCRSAPAGLAHARAPHNARAYALYLRANELARSYGRLPQARDLYEQCLELDPGFAPAWAQLGRCHRVIGKFIDASADSDGPRRGGASAAPSSSTRDSRWRTSTTRTSRRRPVSRARRSCACWARPTVTATTRSSSRASSTPAAIAGSSSSRSPRTRRHGGSTRTCRRASSRRC